MLMYKEKSLRTRSPEHGPPALGALFYFHLSLRRKESLLWLLALGQDFCGGDRREGMALGTVTAVHVLVRDRTLKLLHVSSASPTEA